VFVANELSKDDLRRFARLGAMRRLEDLRQEEAAIKATFPELFRGTPGRAAAPAAAPAKKAARKRSKMSAAARKAVSERMKKYWAGRRKAKNG
jgi:hypothetical protein